MLLQRTTSQPAYADMVQRISTNVLAQATVDGDGLKWLMTSDHEAPDAGAAQQDSCTAPRASARTFSTRTRWPRDASR